MLALLPSNSCLTVFASHGRISFTNCTSTICRYWSMNHGDTGYCRFGLRHSKCALLKFAGESTWPWAHHAPGASCGWADRRQAQPILLERYERLECVTGSAKSKRRDANRHHAQDPPATGPTTGAPSTAELAATASRTILLA